MLSPESTNGTLVAYSALHGRKMPVAIASVDLRVGKVNDDDILKNYIEKYELQYSSKLANGRIINIDKDTNA